jgi:hypothetical protein
VNLAALLAKLPPLVHLKVTNGGLRVELTPEAAEAKDAVLAIASAGRRAYRLAARRVRR